MSKVKLKASLRHRSNIKTFILKRNLKLAFYGILYIIAIVHYLFNLQSTKNLGYIK